MRGGGGDIGPGFANYWGMVKLPPNLETIWGQELKNPNIFSAQGARKLITPQNQISGRFTLGFQKKFPKVQIFSKFSSYFKPAFSFRHQFPMEILPSIRISRGGKSSAVQPTLGGLAS